MKVGLSGAGPDVPYIRRRRVYGRILEDDLEQRDPWPKLASN
jgi:hypothetical protein